MATVEELLEQKRVVDSASRTHRLEFCEADQAGPVWGGVELPDADAFYVVRRLKLHDGERQWVVMFADVTQQACVDFIAGDLQG